MPDASPTLAYIMPSWQEMMILLVLGLILFGRRLPEVGKSLGKTVNQFRRGLADFRREIESDTSVSEARDAVHDLRRAVTTPQRLRDPKRLFDALTDTDLASSGPTPAPSTQGASATTPAKEATPPTDKDAGDGDAPAGSK